MTELDRSDNTIKMPFMKELPKFRLVPRRQDLSSRTHCDKGHEFTAENTITRKDGRRCRQCTRVMQREAKARQRSGLYHISKEEIRARNRVYAARARAKIVGQPLPDLEDSVKKDSLQYLKLDIEGSKASDDLNFAVDRVQERPRCESDIARWMDYKDGEEPTDIEATLMCAGCPFALECDRLADTTKPNHGVWNGKVWIPGVKNPRIGVKRSSK